jgi:legumain
MKLNALLLLSAVLAIASADNWAVIVCGSHGYSNYRHQADTCHAYHIMRKNGIPAENIIMMNYDDAANDRHNPFPGKLFNKPTAAGVPGVDVYEGCVIDYRGKDVVPENFMAILEGDASKVKGGNGRVLKSTENDRVFVNFVDHGGPGVISFPTTRMYEA